MKSVKASRSAVSRPQDSDVTPMQPHICLSVSHVGSILLDVVGYPLPDCAAALQQGQALGRPLRLCLHTGSATLFEKCWPLQLVGVLMMLNIACKHDKCQ